MTSKNELDGLSIQFLKSKFIQYRFIFLVLILLGSVLAIVYNKLTPSYYRISSTILVKSDTKSSELNNVFRDFSPSNIRNGSPVIEDQLGVLKSYNLNFRTLQTLNWRNSWSKIDFFKKSDLYGKDPFTITLPDESIQTENIPLIIEPISENQISVSCDATLKRGGNEMQVDFNNTIKFGDTLKNKYFNFVLNKIPGKELEIGAKYQLIFINLNALALGYKERLVVKPANPLASSNLILVELVTSHLQRDVDYLNQLGRVYLQFGLDEKNRIANNTIKFIDDQITGVDRSLQQAGDQFSSFRSRNRTVDLGQEATTVVAKLKEIDVERSNLELKLEYYNNLKYYLQNRDENKDLVAPSLVGVTDDALNQKVIQLNELYSRREVLSYTAQERNPVLIQTNNQISYIQKSLQENVDNLIANTNVELQVLQQRQRSVNNELSKLPKTEQDLIGIKRNFDLNNELYTFLLQRRAEAEIAKASNNPDAQILDPSDIQIAAPLGPKLMLNLLIGMSLGFFAALAMVIVKEFISEDIYDVQEVSQNLNVSVVGSIGINKYNTEIPVAQFPRSSLTESFRGLRVNLEFLFNRAKSLVLSVHSLNSGEGKSFVAVNLATIFALGGKKVLLIDGDLRKPRLDKIFGIQNLIGLNNLFTGESTTDQIIQHTNITNLDIITSGVASEKFLELMNKQLISVLIEKVRQNYDLIVFDNSPFGIVYDSMVIGANSDFNLVLLRLNFSKKSEIENINKLGREGILPNIMVAVNGVKQKKGNGYYVDDDHTETKSNTSDLEPKETEELSKSAAVLASSALPMFNKITSRLSLKRS
jgi:capsular exopolysaccharide synthesis family protein